MAADVIIITLLYVFVLICDRTILMRKFLLAHVSMPLGAVAAILFVYAITEPQYRDIYGPIEIIVLLGVGVVGTAILVYTTQSLFGRSAKP